jgi:hypothetical protein
MADDHDGEDLQVLPARSEGFPRHRRTEVVPHDVSLLCRSTRLEAKNKGLNLNSASASNASSSAPSAKGKKNKGKSAITSMMEATAYEGHSVPGAPPAPHLLATNLQAIGVGFCKMPAVSVSGMLCRNLMMQETAPRTRCIQEQLLVTLIKSLMVPSPGHSSLLIFKTSQSVWNSVSGLMVMFLMGVLQFTPDSYINLMNEVMFESYLFSSSMSLVCCCVCWPSLVRLMILSWHSTELVFLKSIHSPGFSD